jgi:methionine sulfoxide reductase heme-binding subunit
MTNQPIDTQLLFLAAKFRNPVIRLFQLSYIFLFLLVFFVTWSFLTNNPFVGITGLVAEQSAHLAVLTYIATLIPGIFRRFRINNRLVSILMMYRRYIGILTFFFSFVHMWINQGFSFVVKMDFADITLFGIFGSLAFLIFFVLTITSNDFSVKKMGIRWAKLHSLTYIAVWILFLHIALVGSLVWGGLILIAATAEVSSHLYSKVKK